MTDMFILDDDGNPVAEPDTMKWARWFEDARKSGRRHVGKTPINGVVVSTIFLGIDHNFAGHGEPVLWETIVPPRIAALAFERLAIDHQERYTSKAAAIAGHTRAVDYVLKHNGVKP